METVKLFKVTNMAVLLAVLFASGFIQAADDDVNKEIDALKMKVEALAAALDEKSDLSESKTSIGGYGEHHLNALRGEGSLSDKDQVDAHRYVLFINHQYSEDLKFFSEFELEHSLAGEGKPGEVELEQAFIEKTLANGNRISMGLFLMPIGFLNETHEPDTFYGVERNNVENKIIPTTWWETGVMYSGNTEMFSYDVALHSGLNAVDVVDHDDDALTADQAVFAGIRSGRQKSAEADAKNKAMTARIKGSPSKGLELALSFQYQEDISGNEDLEIDANLITAKASWVKDAWSAKALYAVWSINSDVELIAPGASKAEGITAELAYKLRNDLGVFTRYSQWDNEADDSIESAYDQFDIGLNYWLHERVVLKGDYQMQTKKSDDSELDGINLGLGWSF